MNQTTIRVESLSKAYRIHALQRRPTTLGEQLSESLKGIFRRNRQKYETIWALKDVSFTVKEGEVLGIIGSNGAGKSTLLKVLSRITKPTSGRAEIYGRVASLLEVGTGFHPELTGRENIYLNGTLLGMNRQEINRKFEEIVAFSGVEKFIDTPVKRYSSGMKVRLAFSVAAHLEPEILIVDEVLAVGDVSFQNKCLGKMEEVAHTGRTILFVSHNMGAIANLCTTALCLEDGQISVAGDVQTTISAYLEKHAVPGQADPTQWKRRGTGEARITALDIFDAQGRQRNIFPMGETIRVQFDVEFYRSFPAVDLALEIKRADIGLPVLHCVNQDCGMTLDRVAAGKRRFVVEIPHCPLYPHRYKLSLWVGALGSGLDYIPDVVDFSIIQSNISQRTSPFYSHKGIFYIPSHWEEITV